MSSSPIFCGQPWGLLLRETERDSSAGVILGCGSPRAFVPLGFSLTWPGCGGRPPRAGASFLWAGQRYSSWHIPAGHTEASRRLNLDLTWRCIEDRSTGTLSQAGVLPRPEAIDEDSEVAAQGRFVEWLIHSFQELGQDTLADDDAAAGGLVRRDWKRAEAVWLQPDTDEPRIELIIRLAQDARLIQTLESISRSPRRILLRVREQTPISRVKELDAACIRNYVRLPGRDAIEKAGSRQELLSVQRKTSQDTLENRVTAWTLENLTLRAERWKRLHGRRARTGTRFRAVAALARHATAYRSSEMMAEAKAGSLSHPVPANYPLMMESRYKQVYRTYRALLRYDKIKDDSWTWRRVLWSDAVAQLLSCTLRRLPPPVRELHSSHPYYRAEPDRGRWLVAPASAGPFATPNGPLYIIDAHDADLLSDGSLASVVDPADPIWQMVGVLGSDQILWWPQRKAFFPVWSILWTGDESGWRSQLQDAARAIGVFGARLRAAGSAYQVNRGLLVGSSLALREVDIDTVNLGGATTVGIPIPMNLDARDASAYYTVVRTLAEAIGLAIEYSG
jgi:hypothetical protein